MIQWSRNQHYRNAVKLHHLRTFVTLFMWVSSDYVTTVIRKVGTVKTMRIYCWPVKTAWKEEPGICKY